MREILSTYLGPYRPAGSADSPAKREIQRAAQVLRVAVEFDVLETQGNSSALALGTLQARSGAYDPEVVAELAKLHGAARKKNEIRELPISALKIGMVLAADLKTKTKVLLAARGYEVTPGFVDRARNFPQGTVEEPVRVFAKDSPA